MVATDASSSGGGVAISPPVTFEQMSGFFPVCYFKGRDDLASADYRQQLETVMSGCVFPSSFGWRWKTDEHINVREMRALLVGIQRAVCRSRSALDSRHICLVDNTAAVGAFTRGSSRNFVMNSLLRRSASLFLATGGSADGVWVPTDLQPADEPSRRARYLPSRR